MFHEVGRKRVTFLIILNYNIGCNAAPESLTLTILVDELAKERHLVI